jgi:hypothetical protein
VKIASCATRGICSQTAVVAAPGTKRGICLRQARSWPHDLCPSDLVLQAPESVRAPAGQPGSILKFGNGDKGDDRWPAFEDGPVARCQ